MPITASTLDKIKLLLLAKARDTCIQVDFVYLGFAGFIDNFGGRGAVYLLQHHRL